MKTTFSICGCLVLILVLLTGCAESDADYKELTLETSSMLYECPSRGITMPCERLTAYYGSLVGKCWNSELGNKICKAGWQEVKNIPECVFYGPQSIYICNEERCVLQVE